VAGFKKPRLKERIEGRLHRKSKRFDRVMGTTTFNELTGATGEIDRKSV